MQTRPMETKQKQRSERFKRKVLARWRHLATSGVSLEQAALEIGVTAAELRAWSRGAEDETPLLVPVQVADEIAERRALVVVFAGGVRVEGLTVADAAELVRSARLSDLGYARVVDEAEGLTLGMPPESVPAVIYGTPYFIAPERLRGSPGDFRADIFSIGALWYSMLTGEALLDPRNADSVAIAQRLELPPALRAVLLGALEIRTRRHHSAASMAAAIRQALEDIRGLRQRRRRLGTFAPLLGLLAFPIWLALQPEPAEPACPEPQSVNAPPESACPEPLAFASAPATSERSVLAEPDANIEPPVLAPPASDEPPRPLRRRRARRPPPASRRDDQPVTRRWGLARRRGHDGAGLSHGGSGP